VGGDFYDYYLLDDSRLLILIGDVSDKGIPAALFVSRCKSVLGSAIKIIRAYDHAEPDPARILEFANEELLTANETCMFVTLLIGLLDYEKQEFIFSNAAHTKPFIVSPDGEIHQPEYRKTRPLGLKKDSQYTSCITTIRPGDKLVLYTDGITEAMNPKGEFFSTQRLLGTLAENHACTPEELVRNLIAKVDSFALGQSQYDDIAVVAMSYSAVNV
jgi:sigma-B regulation protein RsbU (phosphoserine phosphatase)